MISAILYAVLLTGPCDGGQCVLPRQVIAGPVTAVVRAPVKVVAKARGVARVGVKLAVKAPKAAVKAARAVVGHKRRAERRSES